MDALNEPTSVKEIIQGMQKSDIEVMQGKIISVSPLQIQITNDEKLVLNQNIICLPRHLSTYQTTVDITGGTVNVQMSQDGDHEHDRDGKHAHEDLGSEEGGEHSHGSAGDHSHTVNSLSVYGATMTVYNGLNVGDTVYIMSFNQGKKYYILDREA